MRHNNEGPFPLAEIFQKPLPTTVALLDLGAFRKPPFVQRLPKEIKTVVIMEDRRPDFFLGFKGYRFFDIVSLNRHGPFKSVWTHDNLKRLVQDLHNQGKEVLIGFWGFWGDGISRPTPWLREHPELEHRRWTESDIGDPFAILYPERISFAKHIANQYQLLHEAFGFDGLFLGDGLCGFRDFWDLNRYRDQWRKTLDFAEFYGMIAKAVHATGGKLWAYDCEGLPYEEAIHHGADYLLLAEAGLDFLVFQSYKAALVDLFRIPGKHGLSQDVDSMQTIREALKSQKCLLYHTLGVGDIVEGWYPRHQDLQDQMRMLDPHSDGRVIVWANGLL
jgi:hypothetical protein